MLNTVLPSPWRAAFQRWWGTLPAHRQDRVASLLPLLAVAMFAMAVVSAIGYLRMEEWHTENQTLQRDGEYSRQRISVRLAERLELLQKFGHELTLPAGALMHFNRKADLLLADNPEIRDLTWLDAQGRVVASRDLMGAMASQPLPDAHGTGEGAAPALHPDPALLARAGSEKRALYQVTRASQGNDAVLGMVVPLYAHGKLSGYLYARQLLSSLLYYAVPSDIYARYTVALVNSARQVLAGQVATQHAAAPSSWPVWLSQSGNAYSAPIAPLGGDIALHLQSYRADDRMVNRSMLLVLLAMSVLTAWALLANWRHLRRRQRSQHALEQETSFRRAMEESMVVGMRALDMEGRIQYVNAAFCHMTGWSPEELIGEAPPYSFWHRDDYERNTRILQKTLDAQIPQGGYEMRALRKNGTTFDARMYMAPLIGADGVQTGWRSSMTDITEPNRIKRQLSSAHERFARVLNSLDATVSVAPLGGKELLFANNVYRQWFGDDGASGHLQMLTEAATQIPAHVEADASSSEGLHPSMLPGISSNNTEVFIPELDRWVEVRSRYLEWVDGSLAQLVIATDITARRHAEELSQQQEARAQAASRLITMGEMASSVAHELNQPLTAITNYCNGMTSRIRAGTMDDDALLDALAKTSRQAQRAGQIIQRIRSFVKRSTPNYAEAGVAGMVTEAVELAEIEMRRRHVRLRSRITPGLPLLHVDRILIEQVLVNLMKNAAEAIDTAGMPTDRRLIDLDVGLAMREQRTVVEFRITDTGKGLSPDTQQHLFEAFFTTKTEGMGIGLNLCRSIVESHHGRLRAENLYNEGQVTGCCFSFWLPVPETGHAG